MTSREESRRADHCRTSGKIAHREYYDAVQHMRRLARKQMVDVGEFTVYRCPDCATWHIGHAVPRSVRLAQDRETA